MNMNFTSEPENQTKKNLDNSLQETLSDMPCMENFTPKKNEYSFQQHATKSTCDVVKNRK